MTWDALWSPEPAPQDPQLADLQMDAAELMSLPLVQIDRELAGRGLRAFIEVAWPQLEPLRPFKSNWHIDAISEHLEAMSSHELTRLLINVPPNTMKSLLTCVLWPLHQWTQNPETKWIFASYGADLSRRDALKMRRVIGSKWFQERWGHIVKPNMRDEWSARKFSNEAGGFRLSTTVGGQATGDHADQQVVDDPIKPRDVTGTLAVSKTTLEKVVTWWDETMASRLVDFELSGRTIIMQRLHGGDLAGHVLREGGYEVLCLPMEFEPKRKCMIELTGWQDPRTEPGELLWPDRISAKAVAVLKKELGARGAAAQLQQLPSPAGGAIFKRDSWQWYEKVPVLHRATVIQSWDMAFKGSDQSDYVCGLVLARIGADYYLLDRDKRRLAFSETCDALRALTRKWPKAVAKVVEDAANGAAVADHLKREVTGIRLVKPLGGKEARANAVEPIFDSGNMWFPHPSIAPWIEDFIEELMAFPAGLHDDQVDALTQGLAYLHKRSAHRYREAMQNIRAKPNGKTNGARTL